MKLRVFILVIFGLSFFSRSVAQERTELTQSRILFLLDESSSMIQSWSTGKEKYKIANELIDRLMDSVNAVNSHVEFSLRVFGNQHTVQEHDCTDTKNEVPFSPDNHTQMSFRLEDLRPLGVTAIAYSLSQAAEHDLVDPEHNAYSIILITDGGESCNGDICGVMEKLIKNKVYFKPYILSLEDAPELKSEYACLGDYLPVTKKSDISKAVSTIVEAFRPMLKISKSDYQKIQTIAGKAPSALKVNMPSIKAEVPETTVPEKPNQKPVDTVAAPKVSHIIVGEEHKHDAPVKLKKISNGKMTAMFVAKPSLSSLPVVNVTIPEIKVNSEEIAPPRAAPVKMKAFAIASYKKMTVVHPSFTDLPQVSVSEPEIKTEPPFVRPAPVKMSKMKIAAYHSLVAAKPGAFVAPFVGPVFPAISVSDKDLPPVRAVFKVSSIAVTGLKKFNTNAPAPAPLKKVKVVAPVIKGEEPEVVVPVPAPAPVVPTDPVVPPAPVVVHKPVKLGKRLKPGNFRMHLLYVNTFLDSDLKPVKLPPFPVFKYTEPPVAPVAPTKPAKPGKPTPPTTKPKTGEYTVEHEDAKETTLQVYLTNGKGKFYSTNPKVIIFDPTTSKEVKRFTRFVDESGNPDQITDMPPGKYDLTIAGREDLLAHVDIQVNKHNKVFVKVKDFSLYFRYLDNANRPVSEFSATVIQRNTDNGKVTVQKCTERLEYEPGNYHIIINTFPEEVRNVDLDELGGEALSIAQPGFVKFTSEVNTKMVALYRELGDKFVKFAELNLDDPKAQHLQIQPGRYQVHYSNGVTKFSTSDRVMTFVVKGTKETEVVLVK